LQSSATRSRARGDESAFPWSGAERGDKQIISHRETSRRNFRLERIDNTISDPATAIASAKSWSAGAGETRRLGNVFGGEPDSGPFKVTVVAITRHYAYIATVTKDEFKKLRAKAGHTQATLAAQMGVHPRTVTRWEIGEIIIPRIAELALRYLAERTKKNRRR
jgi:DNA-binding XRE family transcriptional regulator